MEIKRTVIAIAASLVILIGWNYLATYMGWITPPPPPQEQPATLSGENTPAPLPDPAAPIPVYPPSAGRVIQVETPLYTAAFYTGGGILHSFSLKKYNAGLEPNSPPVEMINAAASAMAPLGLLVNGAPSWHTGSWSYDGGDVTLSEGQTATLTFHGEVNGLRIRRDLTLDAASYAIREKVTLLADSAREIRLGFTVDTARFDITGADHNFTRIAYDLDGSFSEETDNNSLEKGLNPSGKINWAGIMSNYFAAVVSPQADALAVRAKLQNGVYRVAVEETTAVRADIPGEVACLYYLGPKDQQQISMLPEKMSSIMRYGFFSFISRPLIWLLNFFYGFVHNYGVAIILLTLLVKIILWPLSHKSYKSMQQMKKLQPMMMKIKEKHKDDREAMNREIMQLYKTYKVNPMGGCLPIVVQIPVFFGLYQGLLGAIELRHASFIPTLPFTDLIWLADLSAKDPYYITPILMGGTMFLQQWLTPSTGDPTQRKIMMIMPVVFTFLFLNFPAGLVIYWLTNNIISIGQQWWQLRKA